MKNDTDTLTATLEPASRPCRGCYGSGRTLTTLPCPTGGRGPKGGRDGCRTCHGSGRHWDPAVTEVCARCGGESPDRHEDETLYDHVRFSSFRHLVEWRVVDATDSRFTELGLCIGDRGAIMTVGDYGDHRRLTDDELVAAVRDRDDDTPWVFLVRKADMRLCDAVVVVRRRNGYSVRPVWDNEAVGAVA
jgi:hypothetical protein